MNKKLNSYILFPSHTDGLLMEKILKNNKIKYTIVPTPRELSKSCGISIMINPEDVNKVNELIECNSELKVLGIHTIEKRKRKWFK